MTIKYIKTDKAPSPGAYSQAVALLYEDVIEVQLAGQTGNLPPTEDKNEPVIEGGIGPQTTQTLKNLLALVEKAGECRSGGKARHFVKLEVLLKDPGTPALQKAQRETFNEAYKKFFAEHGVTNLPARVMYWVPEVPLEAPTEDTQIEIHGLAVIN